MSIRCWESARPNLNLPRRNDPVIPCWDQPAGRTGNPGHSIFQTVCIRVVGFDDITLPLYHRSYVNGLISSGASIFAEFRTGDTAQHFMAVSG